MSEFAMTLVQMPDELKYAVALGVLFLVRLVLSGRVPDQFITEVAAVIAGAVIAAIELALGLIPAEFETIAAAVLRLIAVLLGSVLVLRAYLLSHGHAKQRGLL
jgi:hypothetical protein